MVKIAQKDVCPDPDEKIVMQEPSKVGANIEKTVGKVLELITDPYLKDSRECKDRCFRLAGYKLSVPQNEANGQNNVGRCDEKGSKQYDSL